MASELPVSEILLAAGFHDQAHFGRAFKQLYRVWPRPDRLTAHRVRVANPQGS